MKSEDSTLNPVEGKLASFIRRRDYRVVRELGEGACGKTVLLHDDLIDEHFVCKKYQPYSELRRRELYDSFVSEIKLLHRLYHTNVVRVFNYHLYPTTFTGYIVMEHVDGSEIDKFIQLSPGRINECFAQTVSGFAYLESCGILHRDIRAGNLMVNAEGVVKIIDLGFGKKIETADDFRKSITLNWNYSPPNEFESSIYGFRTEVYFVGRLFEKLIADNQISDFKYSAVLARMCARRAEDRPIGFADVETEVQSGRFVEMEFDRSDTAAYRAFASEVFAFIAAIEKSAKYVSDPDRFLLKLTEAFRCVSMEPVVPDGNKIIRCVLEGSYRYYPRQITMITVATVRRFLELFARSSQERRRIMLANLHSKLDAKDRFLADTFDDSDIPF